MTINITLSEALHRASPGLQKKMLHSVELLQKAEKIVKAYDPQDGFFLAFSGGKDSQALFHIAQLAEVQFKGHMNLTSVDPPEVIRFIKRNYPEVELTKPKDSIFNIAVKKNILPTMGVRWCCAEFKETAGAGKVTLIGIRHAESTRRAKRNEVEISNHSFSGTLDGLDEYRKGKAQKKRKKRKSPSVANPDDIESESVSGCITGKDSLLVSPIIHWTDKDVWEFLNNVVQVPHCELYDQGWHRIGCIGCPMSRPRQKIKDNERWPHVKRNWIKAIKKIRNGGRFQRRIYLVEHQNGANATRQTVQYEFRPNNHGFYINKQTMQAPQAFVEPHGNCGETVFSSGSSPVRLTEEQENEIAENIYDWWISGKSYQKWYADKFLQLKLNFDDTI